LLLWWNIQAQILFKVLKRNFYLIAYFIASIVFILKKSFFLNWGSRVSVFEGDLQSVIFFFLVNNLGTLIRFHRYNKIDNWCQNFFLLFFSKENLFKRWSNQLFQFFYVTFLAQSFKLLFFFIIIFCAYLSALNTFKAAKQNCLKQVIDSYLCFFLFLSCLHNHQKWSSKLS